MSHHTSPRSPQQSSYRQAHRAAWKHAKQDKGHEPRSGWDPRALCSEMTPGLMSKDNQCPISTHAQSQRWGLSPQMVGTMVPFSSSVLSDVQRHPGYQPTPASGFNQAGLAAPGSVLRMAACPDGACPGGQSLAPSTADHWANGP